MSNRQNGKKLRLLGGALALLCIFALAAFAANSTGKPMNEAEVPGNWAVSVSDPNKVWFTVYEEEDLNIGTASQRRKKTDPLSHYSSAVRALFPSPTDAQYETIFGDHPQFTTEMRANDNRTTGEHPLLSNADMIEYLKTLPTDNLSIRYLGEYPKGIRMPLLVFSEPRVDDPTGENLRALGKPIFYIRAQVHGNEYAATGGALLLAQRIARQHADFAGVLDRMSIVILPRMNGDGTKASLRGTTLVSGDIWISGDHYYRADSNLDQNRDNIWLSAPASRANARVLSEYKPEFCLDAHEYGASSYFGLPKTVKSGDSFLYVTSADKGDRIELTQPGGELIYYKQLMTTQWANHLIIPQNLRNASERIQQKIVAGLASSANELGPIYWSPYVEGGYGLAVSYDRDPAGGWLPADVATGGLISADALPTAAEVRYVRENLGNFIDANGNIPDLTAIRVCQEGGFDPSIARNSMALIPGISFLAESRHPGGRWELAGRVMGQYYTAKYYIDAVMADLDTLTREITEARQAVVTAGRVGNASADLMTITIQYADTDYTSIVSQDIYLGDGSEKTTLGVRKNSRFGTAPGIQVTRPYAYIIDGGYEKADDIAFRMRNLDIRFERLTAGRSIDVVAYTVLDAGNVGSFGAASQVRNVGSSAVTRYFPKGSYICYMDQQMANFAALLFEPMSQRSWIGKDVRNPAAIVGQETPFYRYEKADRITPTEGVETFLLDFNDVTVHTIRPLSVDEMQTVRSEMGEEEAFAQRVTVYGEQPSDWQIRAYLPSDAAEYWWYIRDPNSKEFISKGIARDRDMNRYFMYIDVDYNMVDSSYGAGYRDFEILRTPSREIEHSGSGCDAGFGMLALVAFAGVAASLRFRKP